MTFTERINKSQIALDLFDEYLSEKKIQFAKTGHENLIKSSVVEFDKIFKKLTDDTTKRMRFFPDRLVSTLKSYLVEVKNSKTIEKDAYDIYVELDKIGYNVGICFYHDNKLKFVGIQKLILQQAFHAELPIIDGIWIAPRQLSSNEYWNWKNRTGGSGTTFAYVDFDNTQFMILKDYSEQIKLELAA